MIDSDIRTESNDPMLLSPAASRRLLAAAPWQRYAVLGDSIAQGIGDPSPGYEPRGWVDRVAAVLESVRPGLVYLNTGWIGATSAQALDEQLPSVLEFRPDLVHLNCGGNDFFPQAASPADVRANLDTLFAALTRTEAQVVTFTLANVWDPEHMAPMRQLRDRMAILNDLICELAAHYDALLLELWDHPLRLRPDLMSTDLIHFSMSGHAVLASEVVRTLADRVPAVR
ncbi:SGNH/GDSL hydrolase family protein [Nocardia sp. 004]|uniref:SGNH/GDSL hydrolase family protein n=1 Tax=Nocardia sp. 004 TaxID=3385978 RepID=UPI0039A1CC61